MKKDDLISYSMQLAFLKQLLDKQLISKNEYDLLKERLMKDYKIVSNIIFWIIIFIVIESHYKNKAVRWDISWKKLKL